MLKSTRLVLQANDAFLHLKNRKIVSGEGELYRETKFGDKNVNNAKNGEEIEKEGDKEEKEKVENIKDVKKMQEGSQIIKGKKKISGNVTNLEQQQQQQHQKQGEVEDPMDIGERGDGENDVAKKWGKCKDISAKNILNANTSNEKTVIGNLA